MSWRLPVVLALVVCCGAGCAFSNPANTPTLNSVREGIVPAGQKPSAGQYVVLVPACLVAVAADFFVVHPATVFDDAWYDAADLIWTDMHWRDHYVTECAFLAPRIAAT